MTTPTSNLLATVMYVLSLTIYEIFAKQNAKNFTLKMKVKVKVKEKNGTVAMPLEMSDSITGDFYQNF